jgi:hypothetical protein
MMYASPIGGNFFSPIFGNLHYSSASLEKARPFSHYYHTYLIQKLTFWSFYSKKQLHQCPVGDPPSRNWMKKCQKKMVLVWLSKMILAQYFSTVVKGTTKPNTCWRRV